MWRQTIFDEGERSAELKFFFTRCKKSRLITCQQLSLSLSWNGHNLDSPWFCACWGPLCRWSSGHCREKGAEGSRRGSRGRRGASRDPGWSPGPRAGPAGPPRPCPGERCEGRWAPRGGAPFGRPTRTTPEKGSGKPRTRLEQEETPEWGGQAPGRGEGGVYGVHTRATEPRSVISFLNNYILLL